MMATGPGKYDDICTYVRDAAQAEGVLIIVINGEKGSGFSAQLTGQLAAEVPDMLENMAKQIREDAG